MRALFSEVTKEKIENVEGEPKKRLWKDTSCKNPAQSHQTENLTE
jgi:hypothetical protein